MEKNYTNDTLFTLFFFFRYNSIALASCSFSLYICFLSVYICARSFAVDIVGVCCFCCFTSFTVPS